MKFNHGLSFSVNMSTEKAFANIFGYLLEDSGASFLAKFPVVAGLAWTGRGRGGEIEGKERMVHQELLLSLSPTLPDYVDMIMLPDGSDNTLINLVSFLYCGRYMDVHYTTVINYVWI